LTHSRLLERNVRIGAQGKRLPFPVEATVVSCLPLKLSADRKFPYDVFALVSEPSKRLIWRERGIHATAQLSDCTDIFAWIEFPYHQKCQRLRTHVSCKRGMAGLDPCLSVDCELLHRLQQAVSIRVGDSSGDFVLRNVAFDPATIEVRRYRDESRVGGFQCRKRRKCAPAERGR
jgi:hypothetical protein